LISQLPTGQQWGKVWGDPPPPDWTSPLPPGNPPVDGAPHHNWGLFDSEVAYAANLVDLQWSDERNETMSHLASIGSLFRVWNLHYPQALAHANFCERLPSFPCSNPISDANLSTYIQGTQPDVLTFDAYPPYGSWTDHKEWYISMQRYRMHALAGYTTASGANSGPLPYGQFMKMYRDSYNDETANESFINLQHFASLAFGYTWLSTYIYTRYTSSYPTLFVKDGTNAGDEHPNLAVFDFEQHANAQTMNLSNYFKRAVSTAVFYIQDSHGLVNLQNAAPWNLSRWTAGCGTIPGADKDYIVSITPYSDSTANGGSLDNDYATTIVGYFTPLQHMYDRHLGFANGLHFMIVNGNVGHDLPADGYGQWYHVKFDFTGSSNDSLLKLNRTTGQVELVPLTSMGSHQYYLDIYLAGGAGDVFTFWNSSQPLPGMRDRPTNIVPIVTTALQ